MIILLVILVFALLVLVHELGHFLAARRAGVAVEEFGLGFPPRLFSRRKGDTLYSINLIPLGGFVKLRGEEGKDSGPGSFTAATRRAKSKILLAGVAANAGLAYLILLWLSLTGLPPLLANQFTLGQPSYTQPPQVMAVAVLEGSAAAQAGIRQGDIILEGNGEGFDSEDDLLAFTKAQAGAEVELVILQDGTRQVKRARLAGPESEQGYLGVTPFTTYGLRYGWAAPLMALGLLGQLIWAVLAAVGGLILGLVTPGGEVAASVTGPVGIAVILKNLVNLGLNYVLAFVASISVSLAVMNALPLPALDGGRLVLTWLQYRRGEYRPLPANLESRLHLVGFALLLLLMALITIIDLRRF